MRSGVGVRILSAILAVVPVLALVVGVFGVEPAAAANAPLVVNNRGIHPDEDPTDGVCRTRTGVCTLRAAMGQANYNKGADRIVFDIPGPGPHVIEIVRPLPILDDTTGGTTIDGYTQPGARANTAPRASNAVIMIEVRRPSEEIKIPHGIEIRSQENVIRGLAINNFSHSVHIEGEGADGNKIIGNWIGLTATGQRGTGDFPSVGIFMQLGPDRNSIGTPDLADRNVLSGNYGFGIRMNHGATTENLIQNNIIGLSPNLRKNYSQDNGIDLQWYTQRNLIGGMGRNEKNVIAGNHRTIGAGGIDLSHSAQHNLVLGNEIGTLPGGWEAPDHAQVGVGIKIKDDVKGNYIGWNVVANATRATLSHRHNYTGRNTFVQNWIGVDRKGQLLGVTPRFYAIGLTGHDDLYVDNSVGLGKLADVFISDETPPFTDPHTYHEAEKTVGNAFYGTEFFGRVSGTVIDIEPYGRNVNDAGDVDDGAHLLLNHPRVTGRGPGAVRGLACADCTVEVYGARAEGTPGRTWLGRAQADAAGNWSMKSAKLIAGKPYWAVAIDPTGNTSEMGVFTIKDTPVGLDGTEVQALGRYPKPPIPPLPEPYTPERFDCSYDDGTLSWNADGATTFYVFSTTDGVEKYHGGHTATSLVLPGADSYRVEHWALGIAKEATCAGPGPTAVVFSCSYANGTLSWTDAGATEYYIFSTTNGVEKYHGGVAGTSAALPGADSYRVEHWNGGQTNTTCGGPGGEVFSCSYANGTLSWSDAGASAYYIFSTTNGVETYHGGHQGTSLNLPAADSYVVEHWKGGQTVANC